MWIGAILMIAVIVAVLLYHHRKDPGICRYEIACTVRRNEDDDWEQARARRRNG